MNQLSTIKERLRNISETEFQELADCFLKLRSKEYRAYSRTGAHDIKQKTTKGTPDSFFLMPNGLYLFVESTTTLNRGKKLLDKLKGDIHSCLDEKKTGIPINKIQTIILCYTSNLKANEIEEVNECALKVIGNHPVHYGLDDLATEIFFHHKNLAYDYLGIPLDTGQVVSIEKFIEEYDNGKQKLATPLGGIFLHREKEIENVKTILKSGDIVILSGAAGVGKSKLALEVIKQFLHSNLHFEGYAISPKGVDLIGDLGVYFKTEKENVLLVDDVNRVDRFDQILSFYRSLQPGKLKLILTVRDYALETVRNWLGNYKNSIVEISSFSYEELKTILEQEPFTIRNWRFQHKIWNITKGNARLAVMMAMIVKESDNMEVLNNVADLFEEYFSTFVSDEGAFKDKHVMKALGILSFFYSLKYTGDSFNSVANSISIPTDELRQAFEKLHELDLIELNFENVRVGEQNLSTYFFYKVFIKDRLLSFESLWDNYFEEYEHRFRDTLYPVFQNFGKEAVSKEIHPALYKYWLKVQQNEKKALRFMHFAWEFLPDECLEYLEILIVNCETSNVVKLKTLYERNEFSIKAKQENYLSILSNFLGYRKHLLDVLDLSFQFVEKKREYLPQLIYHLDQNFHFIEQDYQDHFERHAILVNFLREKVLRDRLYALAFFAVSRTLLNFFRWKYETEKDTENDDLNITSVKGSRLKILQTLFDLYSNYPKEVLGVLLDFSTGHKEDNKFTVAFDLTHLIPWIDENLDVTDFRHCYYVQEMIYSAKKEGCKHADMDRLKSKFKHSTYSLYELINWDRRRGRDSYDFDTHEEFESLKRDDLTKALVFKSKEQINQFIFQYREILEWDQIKVYSQHLVLETIIRSNLSLNLELGFTAFIEFVKIADEDLAQDTFISYSAIDSLSMYPELAERFWQLIEPEGLSERWKLELLISLPVEAIKKEHLTRLYYSLNEMSDNYWINHHRFKKYEKIDPNVLLKVLQIIVFRIEDDGLKIHFRDSLLVDVCELTNDMDLLKRAYLQQDEISEIFDYTGIALLTLLKKERGFLLEFIKVIFEKSRQEHARDHKELKVVWEFPDIESLLDEVMEYIAEIPSHNLLSEHFANAFFYHLTDNVERADLYLLRVIEKYCNSPKMINIAFDVIHNSRRTLFERAFKAYISLNQDVECFDKISWTDNQTVFHGDVIVGDVRAAKWKELLEWVKATDICTKTGQIQRYIRGKINRENRYAEYEKGRNQFW